MPGSGVPKSTRVCPPTAPTSSGWRQTYILTTIFPKAGKVLENVLYIENFMQMVRIFPLPALASVPGTEPGPEESLS